VPGASLSEWIHDAFHMETTMGKLRAEGRADQAALADIAGEAERTCRLGVVPYGFCEVLLFHRGRTLFSELP